MQDALTAFTGVIGFLVVFPAFWFAVVWLLSRLSGWSRLALTYAATSPATGEVFDWSSASLRFSSSYSNCLTVTVSDKGIHMATWRIFEFGHQPLFLPWEAIERVVQKRGLFGYTSKLWVAGSWSGWPTITFGGRKLGEAIARTAPQRLLSN